MIRRMAVRTMNTMAEGLQSLLQGIAGMKGMPDVDEASLAFLIDLESSIIAKQREPFSGGAQGMGGGQMPNPGPDGSPFPTPGVNGPPAGVASMAGSGPVPMDAMGGGRTGMRPLPPPQPGMNQGQVNGAAPNPDELRRLMGM